MHPIIMGLNGYIVCVKIICHVSTTLARVIRVVVSMNINSTEQVILHEQLACLRAITKSASIQIQGSPTIQ